MIFYPSKVNNSLNRKPYLPEAICGHVMCNPHYKVTLVQAVPAVCDSGAFQEIAPGQRVLPWTALDRQLRLERHIQDHLTMPWHFEAIVIYDCMAGVDEAIVAGKKVKQRGTETTARLAIQQTLFSARYYASQRDRITGAICFVGQGVTPTQYVQECVLPLLDLMRPHDWFGFGGFCIIGRVPSLKPLFVETAGLVFPLLQQAGIKRAHLLGIGVWDMVQVAHELGAQYGITVSTDTSSVEQNSTMGRVWQGHHWKPIYTKAQKYTEYHPCDLAHENLVRYNTSIQSLT